jgi:ParB family transcriptional regulator, chromosome partitioning protein
MATTSAIDLNACLQYQEIDLALIDEPRRPTRETMDPQALSDLADSIREEGLLKPLIIKPVAGRYEVIAGHRRLMSCRIAEYSPVPCRVKIKDTISDLAILEQENAHTEAVNPVEQARYYARLLEEECGNDVDMLVIRVKRRREFVEDRLLLLLGFPQVAAALEEGKISIAVARELNKTKDPLRALLLLDTSIRMGASARQVMEWRKHYADQDPIQLPPDDPNAAGGQAPPPIVMQGPECFICGSDYEPHTMDVVYIHRLCRHNAERASQQPAGE